MHSQTKYALIDNAYWHAILVCSDYNSVNYQNEMVRLHDHQSHTVNDQCDCIDLLFKKATFSSDAARYIGYELRRLVFLH